MIFLLNSAQYNVQVNHQNKDLIVCKFRVNEIVNMSKL
jgi:hypothetical protein